MTILHDPPETTKTPRAGSTGLFRAFWRWHFYASFLVAPVLLVLATTGLIYLFRFQIEPALHPDLMRVEQTADVPQPFTAQLAAVERAFPEATVLSMREPDPGGPTVFHLEDADVFVDPWTNRVLGSLDPESTVSGVALRLHAGLMGGDRAEPVIELAACWAVVMALTGYYLFVKGWRARRRARRASRLRSRHATVGALVGVGLLGMLVTGLPWTGFWGERAQQLATDRGTSLWSLDPGAESDPASVLDESLPHSHATDVPWALGDSEVPPSGRGGSVADLDTAIAVASAEGLRHPMTVALPGDDGGVFSVIGYAFDAPSDERTVHVDAYGGQVVSTYGYDDYPALAKVVSQGIGLHEGRSLGWVSMAGSALMCLAVIASCITGPLMWWRRRPSGSLGAPRGRLPLRTSRWLWVPLVLLGVLLPFFGISLVVVLLLDQLVIRRVPALSAWFGAT